MLERTHLVKEFEDDRSQLAPPISNEPTGFVKCERVRINTSISRLSSQGNSDVGSAASGRLIRTSQIDRGGTCPLGAPKISHTQAIVPPSLALEQEIVWPQSA